MWKRIREWGDLSLKVIWISTLATLSVVMTLAVLSTVMGGLILLGSLAMTR